ncbi:MAG: hypothetical protein JSW00_08715 [Thermoplasmata archaeon]|nr:MAG: hypothetical protein JSW00_08715 [Thermoplasmata archaeon]
MTYDDLKEFKGRKYMGMPIGGRHVWNYPNGVWKEEKVDPEAWIFEFQSIKQRSKSAPENSGVPINTQYHWYILADQRVRKIDKDTYETVMEGVKHKLSHKRPHWRKWSSEYLNNISDRDRIMAILKDMLLRLTVDRRFEYENAAEMYLKPEEGDVKDWVGNRRGGLKRDKF